MKELMSIIPYVLLPLSMAAAVTIVFVAAMKTLARCFHRPTAIVLALGVTILAVVGTAQIILGHQAGEPGLSPIPSGNALILLPFIALAIASLLAQLLAATTGTSVTGEPGPTDKGPGNAEPEVQPDPQPPADAPIEPKPRGRPKKPSPNLFSQAPTGDSKKKTTPPKSPQPAGMDAAGTQKTEEAAGSADKP